MTATNARESFNAHRQRVVESARARLVQTSGTAPAWRDLGEGRIEQSIGETHLTVRVHPSGDARALPLSARLCATYEVTGAPPDDRHEVRSALEAILESLRDAARAIADPNEASDELFQDLLAGPPSRVLDIDDTLTGRPDLLARTVVEAYRSASRAGKRLPRVRGLPPCLALERRPMDASATFALSAHLDGSCRRCGAAARCPATGTDTEGDRSGLRPLAHLTNDVAAWSCFEAMVDAFPEAEPASVRRARRALGRTFESRRGMLSLPPLPLEFSIKTRGGAVLPRIRFVEYPPDYSGHTDLRAAHGEMRRVRARELFEAVSDEPELEAYDEWLHLLLGLQGDTLECSFGLDFDLTSTETRLQAYAHLDTSDRSRLRRTVDEVMRWVGADDAVRREAEALLADEAARVELVAWAPPASGRRGIKLYFKLPNAEHREGNRPMPPKLGGLATHVGTPNLAVCEVHAMGLDWRKWDFPVCTHYQRSEELVDAFSRDLTDDGAHRMRRLLDGRRFGPWPTWVSVGLSATRPDDTRALYFVPR